MKTLQQERRWCVWKLVQVDGAERKRPFISRNKMGKANLPATWKRYTDMQRLQTAYPEFKGVGFFISDRKNQPGVALSIIDVDAHDIDKNPVEEEVLSLFKGTYIERSQNGKGFHIVCNVRAGEFPRDINGEWKYNNRNEPLQLEVYLAEDHGDRVDHGQFLAATGDLVSDSDEITDQTESMKVFLERYMQKTTQTVHAADKVPVVPLTDRMIRERLNVARRARNGYKFHELYDLGRFDSYASQSQADQALTDILAYFLGRDPKAIDTAFRHSKLMRDKWDERRGNTTYGERTILKAIDSVEEVYVPPETSDEVPECYELLMRGSVPALTGETSPDTDLQGKAISPEDILRMINEVADDREHRDQISVMNLMCGSGKSTAIRMKMRQLIEENRGEGMIVVTDNLDRMRDYITLPEIEDADEDYKAMKEFFDTHRNLITVMTHETLSVDKLMEPHCPILIMSTQRYTGLSHGEIERYLRWSGGERSLIIVDEKPYFRKEIDITKKVLDVVKDAIDENLPRRGTGSGDRQFLQEKWEDITDCFRRIFEIKADSHDSTGFHYRYIKPNDVISKEDREAVMTKAVKHERELNVNRQNGTFTDNISTIRAVLQMLGEGGLLCQQRRADQSVQTTCHVMLDYYYKYTDLDAKVIILDGTADLSMEYRLYGDLHWVPCEQFRRRLDRLHIHLIDMSTGKSKMMNSAHRREVLEESRTFLREHLPADVIPVVFSYNDVRNELLSKYTDAFGEDFTEKKFSWFGVIRGTNDFREESHIAQIGLNRYRPASYFLYELALDPGLVKELKKKPYSKHQEIIQKRIDNSVGYTKEAELRELLAELEQNVFRGTIRNSDGKEAYHFYLFSSFWHKTLLEAIHGRYEEPYKATVEEIPRPNRDRIIKMMTRDNSEYAQRVVRAHDKDLMIGQEYTYAKIAEAAQITEPQCKTARDNNRILQELFNNESIESRNRRFRKTKNWYYGVLDEDDEYPF